MSVAGIIGAGLQLAGTFMQTSAQNRMVAEQTAASTQAENARSQQMSLDAQRRRRSSIREALVARSMALTAGVAQGAQAGSGVASGMGGAMAMGYENQNVANQTEILGGRVFDANRRYFEATQRGSQSMSFGAGLSSLGGMISQNAGTITRLGSYATGNPGFGRFQWG